MSDERRKRIGLLPSMLAVILLASYVGGYFVLGTESHGVDFWIERTFPNRWSCAAYWPMGWAESKLRKVYVEHFYFDPESGSQVGHSDTFYP